MRVSYQQVYLAEKNCSKSKRKGAGCQRFESNLVDNLLEIQQVLQSKTYVPKPMRVFVADNGSKPREIYAPHYYDRVIHHILVSRLEKIIAHKFIHDSCANQKNKGTHFAVARLQNMMRKSSLPSTILAVDTCDDLQVSSRKMGPAWEREQINTVIARRCDAAPNGRTAVLPREATRRENGRSHETISRI